MGAIARNEDGTRVLTDSIRQDLETRHNLTIPEAERLFYLIEAGEDEAQSAEQIKSERRVFRTHVERGYSPESDPQTVAQRKREAEDSRGNVTRLSDLPR